MKAVGTNPLERYVGPETGARHHPTSSTNPAKINSAAPATESTQHAQDHIEPGLDFVPIGWSARIDQVHLEGAQRHLGDLVPQLLAGLVVEPGVLAGPDPA